VPFFSRIATVSVLVLSLGLHWALLQTVAWTGMIVSYSKEGSFQEAVSKTFDGKHPCGLCELVKAGRAEEKKQDQEQGSPTFKLDWGPVWQSTEFTLAPNHIRIPATDLFGHSRAEQPPKPRPRGVFDNPPRV